jgi:hypothetical protein
VEEVGGEEAGGALLLPPHPASAATAAMRVRLHERDFMDPYHERPRLRRYRPKSDSNLGRIVPAATMNGAWAAPGNFWR